MNVNIFNGSPESVEAEVREFLKNISSARIHKILQSESSNADGDLNLTITIFYTE